MKIELAISSIEDIKVANKVGVDRIELCSVMEVLGVTPTISTYIQAKKLTQIPILAYLRPRAGDFIYTDLEFSIILEDAKLFYQNGAREFVFGMLTKNDKINKAQCKTLINTLGKECKFVFHKAFDYVKDKDQGFIDLIDLGFSRVLTSINPNGITHNLSEFKYYMNKYGPYIEIMPGGGINKNTINIVLKELDIKSIHLTAKNSNEGHFKTDFEELKFIKQAAKCLDS